MDLLELLAPIGARKSIRERLRRAHDDAESEEQTGEGVLTRKQAKLLASSGNENEVPSFNKNVTEQESNQTIHPSADVEMPDNSDFDLTQQEEPQLPNEQIQPQEASSSPLPGPSHRPDQTSEDAEDVLNSNLFNRETLVAQNEDLKAYVIKTYFRRIKNFEYVL